MRVQETLIGEPGGGVTDRVREIAAVFERADLAIQVSDNIRSTVWDKLLMFDC